LGEYQQQQKIPSIVIHKYFEDFNTNQNELVLQYQNSEEKPIQYYDIPQWTPRTYPSQTSSLLQACCCLYPQPK
jgi:hypothetical protein